MVANAAGNFVVPAATMSPNAWKVVIEIDLNGTFFCARAAYSALRVSAFRWTPDRHFHDSGARGWPAAAHAGAAKAA